MPCTSTKAIIIAEMKVLSMCKAVDAMLKSDYGNITWDATPIKTILMKFMSTLFQAVIC